MIYSGAVIVWGAYYIDNGEIQNYAIYSMTRGEMYRVDFYQMENGTKPVGEFIRTLRVELRAKVVSDLYRLELLGVEAREPLSKPLGDGIFECRSTWKNNTVRILFFYDAGSIIVATNGFVKKRQKTPRAEIELAKVRRKDYLSRKEIMK